MLEALAPTRLHIDRFLPPTVIRVLVDHQGNAVSANPPAALLTAGDSRRLVSQEAFRLTLFPKMLDAARALATTAGDTPSEAARKLAAGTLDAEIARLDDLASRNSQVSGAELTALRALREETLATLETPRLRLDGLRLIWCA